MDKSADAFRTISEVAEHLDTPAHVLRFWESRFPQIRPVKRAGGRRYYRPSDVSLLTGIKRLLHDEGMTIRGVQKILREQGVRHVAGLSGDIVGDDTPDDAAGFEQSVESAVAAVLDAPPPRPAPGISAAMAKALDHGPSVMLRPVDRPAPVIAAEPALAALILTPTAAPVEDPVLEPTGGDPIKMTQADFDLDMPAPVPELEEDGPVGATSMGGAFPESNDDFDDEDMDEDAQPTLASRIRALPAEASAAKVAAELLAAVARLHALRDDMAEAARTGRA